MNTIKEGRFDDTNQLFSPPNKDEYDLEITSWNYNIDKIAEIISKSSL